MARLYWNIVPSAVINSKDKGWTPIKLESGVNLIPVAVRSDISQTVTVNRMILSKMLMSHRVGLIFHEVVRYLGASDPYSNRAFVALLFKKNFNLLNKNEIQSKYYTLVGPMSFLSFEDYTSFFNEENQIICNELKSVHTKALTSALQSLHNITSDVKYQVDQAFKLHSAKRIAELSILERGSASHKIQFRSIGCSEH